MPRLTARQIEKIASKVASDSKPSTVWRWLEGAAMIAGIIAFGLGVYAVMQSNEGLKIANEQSKLANQEFKEQRIATAWQILAQSGSDSGKQFAIQLLVDEDIEIDGLDISCKNPEWIARNAGDIPKYKCDSPRALRKLTLINAPKADKAGYSLQNKTSIINSRFDGSILKDARLFGIPILDSSFVGTNLTDSHFYDTNIIGVDFTGAIFSATFFTGNSHLRALIGSEPAPTNKGRIAHSSFKISDLSGAIFINLELIEIDFSHARLVNINIAEDTEIIGANISGAIICEQPNGPTTDWDCAEDLYNHTENLWYYDSNPPLGLSQFEKATNTTIKSCPVWGQNVAEDEDLREAFDTYSYSLGCPASAPENLRTIFQTSPWKHLSSWAIDLLTEQQ